MGLLKRHMEFMRATHKLGSKEGLKRAMQIQNDKGRCKQPENGI